MQCHPPHASSAILCTRPSHLSCLQSYAGNTMHFFLLFQMFSYILKTMAARNRGRTLSSRDEGWDPLHTACREPAGEQRTPSWLFNPYLCFSCASPATKKDDVLSWFSFWAAGAPPSSSQMPSLLQRKHMDNTQHWSLNQKAAISLNACMTQTQAAG